MNTHLVDKASNIVVLRVIKIHPTTRKQHTAQPQGKEGEEGEGGRRGRRGRGEGGGGGGGGKEGEEGTHRKQYTPSGHVRSTNTAVKPTEE